MRYKGSNIIKPIIDSHGTKYDRSESYSDLGITVFYQDSKYDIKKSKDKPPKENSASAPPPQNNNEVNKNKKKIKETPDKKKAYESPNSSTGTTSSAGNNNNKTPPENTTKSPTTENQKVADPTNTNKTGNTGVNTDNKDTNANPKKIIDKSELLNSFPKFRKAYSTLPQLTPFIEASIIFTDPIKLDSKTISPREINLFDIPYNNIVSLEVLNTPSTSESAAYSTLILNDTTDVVFLAIYTYLLSLQNSGNVLIQVNYGWVHDEAPRLKSKEIRPIYNIRQMFRLMDVTMQPEANKNIYTIRMTRESFIPRDSYTMAAYKPKHYLGPNMFKPYMAAHSLNEFFSKVFKVIKTTDDVDSLADTIVENRELYVESDFRSDIIINKYGQDKLDAVYSCEELKKQYGITFFKDSKTIDFIKENIQSKNVEISSTPSLNDYVDGKRSFTYIKDDAVSDYSKIPETLQSIASNDNVPALQAFYYLCKQAKDHADKLNYFCETKTMITFINLLGDTGTKGKNNEGLLTFAAEYFNEYARKGLGPTLDPISGEITDSHTWEEVLDRVAKHINLSFVKLKNNSVAKLNIKSHCFSKTGDFEKEISELIEYLDGLQKAIAKEDSTKYIGTLSLKIKSRLEAFANSEYDTIVIYIIYPELQTSNNFSNVGEATRDIIKSHKTNFIAQTYTVNGFKELGSRAFAGKFKKISEESFPDVISFKVSSRNLGYLEELVPKLKEIQTQPTDLGNKVIFVAKDKGNLKMREFGEINRMVHYHSAFYTTDNNYGESFASNIEARNNLTTTLANAFGELDAEMEILGEPAYSLGFALFNRIFIKIFNPDGSTSFLSGVYFILSTKHNINSGRFTTIFTLKRDKAETSYIIDDLIKDITIANIIVGETNTQKPDPVPVGVSPNKKAQDTIKTAKNKSEANKKVNPGTPPNTNANKGDKVGGPGGAAGAAVGAAISGSSNGDKLIQDGDLTDAKSLGAASTNGNQNNVKISRTVGTVNKVTPNKDGTKNVNITNPQGTTKEYNNIDGSTLQPGDPVTPGTPIGETRKDTNNSPSSKLSSTKPPSRTKRVPAQHPKPAKKQTDKRNNQIPGKLQKGKKDIATPMISLNKKDFESLYDNYS